MVIIRCSRCSTGYRMDPARVPAAGMRVRCPNCGHAFRVRLRQPEPVHTPPAAPTPAPAAPAAPARPAESVLPGLQRDDGSSLLGSGPSPTTEPSILGSRPTPAPSAPEPEAKPDPVASQSAGPAPWSRGERTIDFDAGSGRDESSSQLETPPFRPGAAPAAPTPASAPETPARPAGGAPPMDERADVLTPGTPAAPQPEVHPDASPVVPSPPFPTPVGAPPTAPRESAADSELPREHQRARRLARVLVSDILVYNQESRDKALAEGTLITALSGEVNKAWELYKTKVSQDVLGETDYFKDALNDILAEGRKVF